MIDTALYLSLEELSAQTLEFARQAHQRTQKKFSGSLFEQRTQEVLACLQNTQNIPLCEEHQSRFYHFLQDAEHPKGLYRSASSAYYRAGIPDWQTLFYIADFDEILQDNVYLKSVVHCEIAPHQVLLFLSSNGSDLCYVIEFDLQSKSIVENGFHLPPSKSRITWKDRDSVWICPAWDSRQCTESGYPREVWHWQRGQQFSQATPIFQANQEIIAVDAWRYLDAQGSDIDIIAEQKDFFNYQYYIINSQQEYQPIRLPENAQLCGYLAGHFLVQLQNAWQYKQHNYPSGSLLFIAHRQGQIKKITLLFAPNKQQSIECVETSRHFIVLHYLDNIKGCLKAWKIEKGQLSEHPVPSFSEYHLELIDQPWGGDMFYLWVEDLIHPPVLYLWNAKANELSVIRRQKPAFNSEKLTLKQYQAHSQDGTAIPYFWCGEQATEKTPTLIYVYGGFAISQLPHYLANLGQQWLAQGGAFVIANVRGGGELGNTWHSAAQGINKQKTVDDLLAIVQHLHQHKMTSPAHTAIQGGSNGGLIAAAAIVQAASSFAAAVIEAPITDLMRFHHLGAGASWITEYGNPEQAEFQAALKALSPLHQIKTASHYPPLLITTDLNDDRTHPAHALKLYARCQEVQTPAWLYLTQGGHDGQATQKDCAQEFATIITFLNETLAIQSSNP